MDSNELKNYLFRFLGRQGGMIHKILTYCGIFLNGFLRVNYNMLILLDDEYTCFKTTNEFEGFITKHWIEYKEQYFLNYKKNVSDCDNAAFLFQQFCSERFGINGVAVYLDYDGAHAYNLIITETGFVLVFEPQNGLIIKEKDLGRGSYICKKGTIVI